MSDSNRYDTIVVGVGGMGSATCYQLARRGSASLGWNALTSPTQKVHRMGLHA